MWEAALGGAAAYLRGSQSPTVPLGLPSPPGLSLGSGGSEPSSVAEPLRAVALRVGPAQPG